MSEQQKTILITGGTGLIGSALIELIKQECLPYRIILLSRRLGHTQQDVEQYQWDIEKQWLDPRAIETADYIIHLAGAGIADRRWTPAYKQIILKSRIDSTRLLFESLEKYPNRVKRIVAASAVGYYGFDTGSAWMYEESPPGSDFLAQVVVAWEKEIERLRALASVVALRIGIVLSRRGGALPQLVRPVRWGVGAPLGSGKQYLSWIHIEDLCRMFLFALEAEQLADGVYNAVEGSPVTNATMTQTIADVLGRPLWLPPVPAAILHLLLGEMAQLVLGGNRVSNEKILGTGFQYRFTDLRYALQHLLFSHKSSQQ